jgi:hypothetical protein
MVTLHRRHVDDHDKAMQRGSETNQTKNRIPAM